MSASNSHRTNQFVVDPSDFWRRHYEQEAHRFMAALMRHFEITQIEIPASEIYRDSTVEWNDKIDTGTRFYRIVGELKLEEKK